MEGVSVEVGRREIGDGGPVGDRMREKSGRDGKVSQEFLAARCLAYESEVISIFAIQSPVHATKCF